MSQPAPSERSDPIRKTLIVTVLVAAMVLLFRFALPTGDVDPTGMLALGFVVLAGYALGELVGVVKLPHITGYLIGGLLLGPSMAQALPEAWRVPPFEDGILNHEVLEQLDLLNILALALIALTAGGELKVGGLRRDLRAIGGILGGQVAAIAVGAFVLVLAVGGMIPAIALEPFASLDTAQLVALAALLGVVSIATSPAATIAVINGSGARGLVTRTVLSTVVVKDVVVVVLFSVVGAFAGQMLGAAAQEGSLGTYLLVHVAGSLVFGAVVGAGLALYLRFVAAESQLFLVGLIYTATFVAHELHLDPLLLFMAAGFVTANFSQEGDRLIHEVERLSMPVYVVFFTLAGAALHLDSLAVMAPYALALVGVRILALWVGTNGGAAFVNADSELRRHGWLGFVSQAGVALSLAALIGETYGEAGTTLSTLIIASLAINELIGPVLLKLGLGLAGEIESRVAEEPEGPTEVPVSEPDEGLAPWSPPAYVPDPWGPDPEVSSDRLRTPIMELQADLQSTIRDLLQGPLNDLGANASSFLRALRREFLRHHRRARVRLQGSGDLNETASVLRREQSDLAERWRALVLDRAARLQQNLWTPWELVVVVDTTVDGLPERVEAPWEPRTFVPDPDEAPWKAVQRGWLRFRERWSRVLGQEMARREVHLADLARYHLSGNAPADLEPLAALMVHAESHLANRTRALFDTVVAAYDRVAALADEVASDEAGRERFEEALSRVRSEVDEEFTLAGIEIDHMVQDGALRGAIALGTAMQRIKEDLPIIGTLDLPERARRYSKVFPRRTRAQELLVDRLGADRVANGAQYAALALELELIGLEGRIKQALQVHGSQLARMVNGRGPKQLERVTESLATALQALEAIFDSPKAGDAMATAIREAAEPLERVVAEATRGAEQLREYLADEEGVAPLLDELVREAGRLTERYTVPTSRMLAGERSLPQPPGTATVPTRELTLAYIESAVSRGLVAVSRELAEGTERLERTLEELERVVAFNVELAGAELDVLAGESVSEETRNLCAEMLLGALGRSRTRVDELRDEAAAWPEAARVGVREAVLGGLGEFRTQMVDGRVTELRLRLLRERATSGRLARDAEEWRGGLLRLVDRAGVVAVTAVGTDRIERLRDTLGLPLSERSAEITPATFAPPGDPARLPIVYRRLFSDQALEAGDLLTGRQDEIGRARRALLDAGGGRLRAVALVGVDGAGKGAVINAVLRGLSGRRIVRIDPRGPVTVEEVERWLADLTGDELVLVEGLKWLFAMRPGGFAPLRRWVDGVIAHAGDVSWMISASSSVWGYACAAAPLEDAFAEVIHLRALEPHELQAAVIARHAMSGYKLRFEAEEDLGWQLQRLLVRGRDQEARQRDAWFNTLHQATEGVIHDALAYWMASIRKVDADEGVVRVGPVPRPPLAALERLADDVMLTLGQVMRQGWITAEIHADLFRQSPSASAAHLARLAHYGILVDRTDHFRIAPHLLTAVRSVLRERGWVE